MTAIYETLPLDKTGPINARTILDALNWETKSNFSSLSLNDAQTRELAGKGATSPISFSDFYGKPAYTKELYLNVNAAPNGFTGLIPWKVSPKLRHTNIPLLSSYGDIITSPDPLPGYYEVTPSVITNMWYTQPLITDVEIDRVQINNTTKIELSYGSQSVVLNAEHRPNHEILYPFIDYVFNTTDINILIQLKYDFNDSTNLFKALHSSALISHRSEIKDYIRVKIITNNRIVYETIILGKVKFPRFYFKSTVSTDFSTAVRNRTRSVGSTYYVLNEQTIRFNSRFKLSRQEKNMFLSSIPNYREGPNY